MTRGIDPEIWGPSGWKLLHGLSFMNVPVTKTWYLNLQYILPCKKCQQNFKTHIEALGSMHKNVRRWVYKLHERVNRMKEKDMTQMPTYGETVAYWKRHGSLQWDDIIPFLDAVVEAHPNKGCVAASAHWAFWQPLFEWMDAGTQTQMSLTPEITESRTELRRWWKNYKKSLK